jgi:hypothetical protein
MGVSRNGSHLCSARMRRRTLMLTRNVAQLQGRCVRYEANKHDGMASSLSRLDTHDAERCQPM